jgi:hypothetical protein
MVLDAIQGYRFSRSLNTFSMHSQLTQTVTCFAGLELHWLVSRAAELARQ